MRPYTAWWLKYPGKEERASELLKTFRPAIERRIHYWEWLYPNAADWEHVLWDAAYRAAWRCDGINFWPLLRRSLQMRAWVYLSTHRRHEAKIKEVQLTPVAFDSAYSGVT